MCYGVVLMVDHRYTECGGYKGITSYIKQLENEYSGRID